MRMDFPRFFPQNRLIRRLLWLLAGLLLAIEICLLFFPVKNQPRMQGEKRPPAATPVDSTLTRREGCRTILITGLDEVSSSTDVMMLALFDETDLSVTILQIPRDTFFRWQDTDIKINSLYKRLAAQARAEGHASPSAAAMDGLCAQLSEALGIPVDFWLLTDLESFSNAMDALGGVTITLPRALDYDDPTQDLSIHLPAGKQRLDGEACTQFVRFRSGYAMGDLGRLDAQKIFLSALFTQLQDQSSLPTLIRLCKQLLPSMTTSLPLNEALQLLRMLPELHADQLTFATLPGSSVRGGGTTGLWYYVLNRAAAEKLLRTHFSLYQGRLPENCFDPSRLFTNSDNPYIEAKYTADILNFPLLTAEDINQNGVSIPAAG